jgi:similar to stage IV sporulation protein
VQGEFIEKLLNMAGSRGIILWDIIPVGPERLELKVRIHGFKMLRHIARKQKCKMKIMSKRGLPFFVARFEKRKMLVVGAIGFSTALYVLSSFVWFIEIEGMERVKPEQILTVAEREGLYVGAVKREFNPDQVERAIGRLPQVAWVGITVKGTRVTIEIAEKVLPDVVADETIPAHLVAANDGLVHEMLVLAGVPAVKVGDTVQKGQILISGYVFPTGPNLSGQMQGRVKGSANGLMEIRAKGIVRARVWYEETAQVLLEEKGYKKTGSFSETVAVKVLNKEIIVRGPKKSLYPQYSITTEVKKMPQWRNLTIPVEVIYYTYYELKEYHRSFTREQALDLAVKEAKEKISLFLSGSARIVNHQVTELPAGDNEIKIRLTAEAVEDIAIPYAIRQK